eukprot:9938291-Prorocentrum_lima.AAC.1
MHPHLRSPCTTARGSMIDKVRRYRSAPRTAPSTLLNAGERDVFSSKGRRKHTNAGRVKGVGAAER